MSRITGTSGYSATRDRSSNYGSTRPSYGYATRSDDPYRSEADERARRRGDRGRVRDERSAMDEPRRERRSRRESDRPRPRLRLLLPKRSRKNRECDAVAEEPLRESTSAYLGESTVVGVTRRSERRDNTFSSGLSLVPPSWPDASSLDRQPAYRDERDQDGWGTRSSAWDAGGYDDERFSEYQSGRDANGPVARSRVERQNRRGNPLVRDRREPERTQKRGLPDYIYTGESTLSEHRQPARRRGAAIADAFLSIPRACLSGAYGALRHTGGLLMLTLVILSAVMLYAPARELYVANRRLDELQATYDALLDENASIRNDLEVLQTREGIENEARARGYVEAGETKVIVEGLSEDAAQQMGTAQIPTELEVSEDNPWYIQILDQVFAYKSEV